MALTPLDTPSDPLPSPNRPDDFEGDMDRFINTKLPLLATEVDGVATAFTLNATNSTSTSSVLIGTGTRNYTVETGKSYVGGMYVIAADSSSPSTNYNYGQVLSYDSGTGAISIDVIDAAGSGTLTSWVLSQTSPGGVTAAGATFTGDVVVPADVYDSGWDANNSAPTKNDLYDELQKAPTETALGRVEKATAVEAAAFASDKYIDGARLKDAFNATGSAPFFACRAFGEFDGTGIPAYRSSGNMNATITDRGTGQYSVAFSTNMASSDYLVLPKWGRTSNTTAYAYNVNIHNQSASGFDIDVKSDGNSYTDLDSIGFAVFA